MSKTPRTDARELAVSIQNEDSCCAIYVKIDGKEYEGGLVDTDFARELECENVKLSAETRTADGVKWSEISEMWRHKFEAAERELAELRKDKARLESNYYDVADAITRESSGVEDLCKQARELRKDKARLDWLADTKNTIGNVTLPTQHIMDHPDSMRAAIDAAMEANP
jgi:predicted nuclease with TOPRIM domain